MDPYQVLIFNVVELRKPCEMKEPRSIQKMNSGRIQKRIQYCIFFSIFCVYSCAFLVFPVLKPLS